MCHRWHFTDEMRYLFLVGRTDAANRQNLVFAQDLARMDGLPRLRGFSVEGR